MLAPFEEIAISMLRKAGIKPVTEDVIVLGDDLRAIADDEFPELDYENADTAIACGRILDSRIGGRRNIESYVKVLRAGKARKELTC